MNVPHSDALVFFGATGDLIYKKIFPALYAMERRGHLQVPVIGVARSDWTIEQFRARARESIEQHDGFDEAVFAKLPGAAPLHQRRLRRSGHPRRAPQGTRRCGAPAALSRNPSQCVRGGGRGARPVGLRPRRALSSRSPSAVTSRPRRR